MEEQVLHYLQATLSPQEQVRRNAEEQLEQLFLHPEGGLILVRILLSHDVQLPQRQSAGILLQQYISQHWYLASDAFQDPVTPSEVKAQIRPIVFRGLSDRESKIRSASAFALSTIARYDWPDDYPGLLSSLISLLNAGSPDPVHGAMRVIAEFVKNDLSQDQLLPVVNYLVPSLLAVLGNQQSHSPFTRASTINVFRQVMRMLETVRDEHPQAVRQALKQIAPIWLQTFQQMLAADAAAEVSDNWEMLGIRIEILRTLTLFQSSFPRVLANDLSTYLHLSIANLTSLLPLFHMYYLSSSEDAPEPPSPTPDVGFIAPRMDLDDLACAVFDFLTPIVRTTKAAPNLVSGETGKETGTQMMEKIFGLVLCYIQVTRANEREWLENANAFIMDDDSETEQYGLRVVGLDLIGSLINKWPRAVARILQGLTHQIPQRSAAAHLAGDSDWWKSLEALLALLGGIADDISGLLEMDATEGRSKTLDVKELFDHVIPGLLDQSDTPFLQGRAFVFASQYASNLPDGLVAQYIAAAVHVLESPTVPVTVKVSAVKTIKNFCRHVDSRIVKTQSGKILSLILPLLPHATNETLYLLLETLRAVLEVDKELLTPEFTPELAVRLYETWFAFSTDPVLTAIVEELFEAIAVLPNPAVVQSVVAHVAPMLKTAIGTPVVDDTIHLPGEAVQLANSLLRGRAGPIEDEMVVVVTTAVIAVLRTTDDMDVIQHGMIHLTLVVRKDCEKLVNWRDEGGLNGIESIFGLLGRFLEPTFSESGGIFVGELIMHLFRKAGAVMGPVLPDLLRAIVNRLASAQLPSFVQSLILPFAYLFGTEYTQSTINLLSQTVPTSNDSNSSALDLVLAAWCDTSDTISGSWNIRVSDLGLSKLFAMPEAALLGVIVKGDLIISETNRDNIMTRSRTKTSPNQYTQIAFPVKALKLLLKDVQTVGPRKTNTGKRRDIDVEEDDGDVEWDDDDPLGDTAEVGEFDYLSSWMDDGPSYDDAQDDDEDLRSDPIAHIDIGEFITHTLRQCYASNANGMHQMIGGLTEGEKGILRGVLTL